MAKYILIVVVSNFKQHINFHLLVHLLVRFLITLVIVLLESQFTLGANTQFDLIIHQNFQL